jgi:hypothetical protein
MKLDDFSALLWVHGATNALNPRYKYFQGKRRIPAPLTIRRHAGRTDLQRLAEEILMNWNTFDLYTKLPATVHSCNEIARIGSYFRDSEQRPTIIVCSYKNARRLPMRCPHTSAR